jgi:hypothetical protein
MVEPVHSLFSEDSGNFATNKRPLGILSISHLAELVQIGYDLLGYIKTETDDLELSMIYSNIFLHERTVKI